MELQVISDRHHVFVEHLLNGSGIAEAGRIAGFKKPARDAVPVIVEPIIQRLARKQMRGKLELEAAPAAYKVLFDLMMDKTTDKRLRSDIAKYLHSAAGYTPPKAADAPDDANREKAPHEMTTEELHRFIEDGEAEMKARTIDVTPTTSGSEAPGDIGEML